jgi:predicted signal transduction protein with EAL and GGDEF domain
LPWLEASTSNWSPRESNWSQARQLHLLGCGSGQGYFYGRPMPAERLEASMSTWDSPLHCAIR